MYQDTLTNIFDQISQAYASNNQIKPDKSSQLMRRRDFGSVSELKSYANSKKNGEDQLCLSFGFSNFDSENDKFQFRIYLSDYQLPSTNSNQVFYDLSTYAVDNEGTSSFDKLNYTGFEQLMTTATSAVLQNVY